LKLTRNRVEKYKDVDRDENRHTFLKLATTPTEILSGGLPPPPLIGGEGINFHHLQYYSFPPSRYLACSTFSRERRGSFADEDIVYSRRYWEYNCR